MLAPIGELTIKAESTLVYQHLTVCPSCGDPVFHVHLHYYTQVTSFPPGGSYRLAVKKERCNGVTPKLGGLAMQ